MTKDQAISVKVRLETAIIALQEAQKQLPALDGDKLSEAAYEATETVNESLEDALSACATALSMAESVIGA